jgi:phenylacetate-CoA ligase
MNKKALAEALSQAYDNPYSDFYRALYASRGFLLPADTPHDQVEWSTIPLLSKEDIASTPLEKRIFVPKEDVLFYRTSTGTSNRGVVIIPRNLVRDLPTRTAHATRMLEFLAPHHFSHFSAEHSGTLSIAGDRSDLPATARLAARFAADGISATPTILAALIPELEKELDLANIRYLYLWGERISHTKRALLYEKFPNAYIEYDYALSELHGVGGAGCEKMIRAKEFFVHPHSDLIYWELVDPQTGAVVEDEGEIVITTLWANNAFPGIRYRTGDLARRVEFPCDCGREAYEILGRSAYDRALLPGGMVTSAELERSLALYRDLIEDDFELHIFDIDSAPRLELHIRTKEGVALTPAVVAAHMAESLSLSPHHTLQDQIRAGLVAELKCVLLPAGLVRKDKQIRIVTH